MSIIGNWRAQTSPTPPPPPPEPVTHERFAISYPLGDLRLLPHQVRELVGQPVMVVRGEHYSEQPYRVVRADQRFQAWNVTGQGHDDSVGQYVLTLGLER